MITALLVTALVLALLGMWFLVFVIECMSAVKQACKAYIRQAEENPTEVSSLLPPVPWASHENSTEPVGHRRPRWSQK